MYLHSCKGRPPFFSPVHLHMEEVLLVTAGRFAVLSLYSSFLLLSFICFIYITPTPIFLSFDKPAGKHEREQCFIFRVGQLINGRNMQGECRRAERRFDSVFLSLTAALPSSQTALPAFCTLCLSAALPGVAEFVGSRGCV